MHSSEAHRASPHPPLLCCLAARAGPALLHCCLPRATTPSQEELSVLRQAVYEPDAKVAEMPPPPPLLPPHPPSDALHACDPHLPPEAAAVAEAVRAADQQLMPPPPLPVPPPPPLTPYAGERAVAMTPAIGSTPVAMTPEPYRHASAVGGTGVTATASLVSFSRASTPADADKVEAAALAAVDGRR